MNRMFKAAVVGAFIVGCIGVNASDAEAQWRSIPYSSGDFTASGSMTWTVDEGDLVTYRYVVNDRTMTVGVEVRFTSVGGTVSQSLMMRIPGGYRAGSGLVNAAILVKESGSPYQEVGFVATAPDDEWLYIKRLGTLAHQSSTDATHVYFTATFDLCADDPGECS